MSAFMIFFSVTLLLSPSFFPCSSQARYLVVWANVEKTDLPVSSSDRQADRPTNKPKGQALPGQGDGHLGRRLDRRSFGVLFLLLISLAWPWSLCFSHVLHCIRFSRGRTRSQNVKEREGRRTLLFSALTHPPSFLEPPFLSSRVCDAFIGRQTVFS